MAMRGAATTGKETIMHWNWIPQCPPRTELKYPICAVRGATAVSINSKKKESWKIKMFYDGDCPLCMREVMGRIHAILSDGTVLTDVEANRRLYEQVGLGWVFAITRYEPIATLVNALFSVWAKFRHQITGRLPLDEILELRKKKHEVCDDSSACKK